LPEKLHQSPQAFGQDRSRWTLDLIHQQFLPSLHTVGGVWRRLQKWQIALKQGRFHITSPDPEYTQKVEAIAAAYQQMQKHPDQKRLLYVDELTLYRQPVLSSCYHERGKTQPHAQWPGG